MQLPYNFLYETLQVSSNVSFRVGFLHLGNTGKIHKIINLCKKELQNLCLINQPHFLNELLPAHSLFSVVYPQCLGFSNHWDSSSWVCVYRSIQVIFSSYCPMGSVICKPECILVHHSRQQNERAVNRQTDGRRNLCEIRVLDKRLMAYTPCMAACVTKMALGDP